MRTDRLKIVIRAGGSWLHFSPTQFPNTNYELVRVPFAKVRDLFVFVILGLLLSGIPIQAEEYSKPVEWVNDFAGVISPEYKSQLTNLISEIERKTGAEIAIATVKTSYPQSIDMYAVELFTRWGIGKKDKDNGVLIVAAIDDRKVWIETGYGLEGVLPDGLCGEIYRQVLKPNFQQGEFGKGLLLATSVIADKIGKEQGVEITGTERAPQISYSRKSRAGMLFPLLFLLLIFSGRFFLPLLLLGGMRGGYWGSGTFGGGGGFGGGFGGFGGGSCGGGGAGGGW